jgi:hypothetical protein
MKECPFCKSANQFVERQTMCVWQVQCECGARGPLVEDASFDGDEEAARVAAENIWNGRA